MAELIDLLYDNAFDMLTVKTYAIYRSRLWGAIVRLYDGGRDANFIASFVRTIDAQLTEAWIDGAQSVGVDRDEMTDADWQMLKPIIDNESEYIEGLLNDIDEARENQDITRADFERQYASRCDIWANRYNETVNRARAYFGGKKKLEWVMGATEEHCETCKRLNGIVAYAEEWEQADIRPQTPPNKNLECEGWRCACELSVTTRRRTPRAMAILTNIVMERNL